LLAYLLENGNLLRSSVYGVSAFSAPGIGGRLELFNWEGDLLWSYNYANQNYHQHHDFEYMPNGNVLLIAWEFKTGNDAENLGRVNVGSEFWPLHIVELEPVGTDEANIVWEWHAWDHLIQDVDPNKPNYGVVAEHPERININVATAGGTGYGNGDWMHCNSIDYNAELDQILVNSKKFKEFWIIDHSTTTQEAASSSGGNQGKGGDILYRWGNPQNYDRGTQSDLMHFGAHDVHWIEEGLPNAGKIIMFNNGQDRPEGNYSSVDIITPPLNTDGSYDMPETMAFEPNVYYSSYFTDNTFYSAIMSSADVLPNGNMLITEGTEGRIFEINENGNLVWEYITPVGIFGVITQEQLPLFNTIFRAYRYGQNYGAFDNKDLTTGDPVENNPIDYGCELYENLGLTAQNIKESASIRGFPNPVKEQLFVTLPDNLENLNEIVCVIDVYGNMVAKQVINGTHMQFDTTDWPSGMYLLQMSQQNQFKFVKW